MTKIATETTHPDRPAAPARPRPLVPREHGAWGQLAMPLLTALAIGRPTPAALLLASAVVLAFIAHEPVLVLVGHRGARVRGAEGRRAIRWLVALLALAAATGSAGVALAPRAARVALTLPVALAGVVALLVWRRLEKTTAGEMVVAATLASAGYAVALAAGAPRAHALAALLAWVLAFAAATLAVHVILVRVRTKGARDPGLRNAALAAALAFLAVGLSAAGLPGTLAVATAPTVIVSVAICLSRVSPRRLRELGWALVGSSAVTLVILVAGLRGR